MWLNSDSILQHISFCFFLWVLRPLLDMPCLCCSYGSKGHGENVPPDSWLVYDVELVKVHWLICFIACGAVWSLKFILLWKCRFLSKYKNIRVSKQIAGVLFSVHSFWDEISQLSCCISLIVIAAVSWPILYKVHLTSWPIDKRLLGHGLQKKQRLDIDAAKSKKNCNISTFFYSAVIWL